jgi:hypothetical protein
MLRYIVLLVFLCFTITGLSQESSELLIGPGIAAKGGMNGVTTPSGRQNDFAFSSMPDFRLDAYYSLNSIKTRMSVGLSLGYSSYAYYINETRGEKREFKHNYSYFSISPGFQFDILQLEFLFGLPLAADMDGKDISASKLNTIAELRLTGNIPLYDDESGSLYLFVGAGYMLTGMYKSFETDDPLLDILIPDYPQTITNQYNPRVASIFLGIKYLLNVPI